MLMSNIPRRKIYEELLIFEEGILEIDRMIYNTQNTLKYQKFFPEYIKKISDGYYNIKVLLVLMLENKKFDSEEKYTAELKYYKNNPKETLKILKKSKKINKKFLDNCQKIKKEIEKQKIRKKINADNLKLFLETLDKFNSEIPKILEIQRQEL